MIGLWLKALLASRAGRLAGAVLGVGLTVALIAAVGTFTVSASRSMTARAIAGLPVDWQVALPAGSDPAPVVAALDRAAPHTALATVGYADAAGLRATTGRTEQTTGPGKGRGAAVRLCTKRFPARSRCCWARRTALAGAADGGEPPCRGR